MTGALPLFLAPMAGITDRVFRSLCFAHGCDIACTEMVSAQGLMQAKNTQKAYGMLLDLAPGEKQVNVQLFGRDPYYMAEAARKLTDMDRFSAIDINMGCPAQKVVGGGSGSALMKTPSLAGQIVRETVRSTCLPVTVKMRLGWDESSLNAPELARIAEDNGASAVTVHGRTRVQQYAGRADWHGIALVKQAVSIPVYCNGDIVDGATAREALRVTGCDGIAVGRGALGNPWVFEKIKAVLSGREEPQIPLETIIRTALEHARAMCAWKEERIAIVEMRKHLSWYVSGIPGARMLRTRLHLVQTYAQAEEILKGFMQNAV